MAKRPPNSTIGEITAAAQVMREFSTKVDVPDRTHLVDIVGTGGDGSHTFNISTCSMFVAAAAGARVSKHGGRSVSSKSGSADVLEALGVPLGLSPKAIAQCIADTGIGFMFAPNHHPAMKNVAPVRKELGVRTIFNILGPLTNPAGPPFHLIGAFSLDVAKLIAETIAGMPIERTFVVHGAEGWDEPTPIGPFTVFDVRPGRVEVGIRRPEDYGFGPCKSTDLAGGDAQHNAGELKAVLEGRDRGPHRDCLLLGTALAPE